MFITGDMDDTKVGASSKDSAEQVAKQGFEALMKGEKKLVGGGLGTKAQGLAAKVLPDWARGGFTDPEPVMPFVVGERGEIVAILWPDLVAPPQDGRGNKILWVAREHTTEPFTITARLGTTAVTTMMQQGPGPSTIDVPGPGCWTFDLRWGTHQDTLVLPYRAG